MIFCTHQGKARFLAHPVDKLCKLVNILYISVGQFPLLFTAVRYLMVNKVVHKACWVWVLLMKCYSKLLDLQPN